MYGIFKIFSHISVKTTNEPVYLEPMTHKKELPAILLQLY